MCVCAVVCVCVCVCVCQVLALNNPDNILGSYDLVSLINYIYMFRTAA